MCLSPSTGTKVDLQAGEKGKELKIYLGYVLINFKLNCLCVRSRESNMCTIRCAANKYINHNGNHFY